MKDPIMTIADHRARLMDFPDWEEFHAAHPSHADFIVEMVVTEVRALEAEGWRFVKEPTYEMLAEMRGAFEGGVFEGVLPVDQEALRAALSAAPTYGDKE